MAPGRPSMQKTSFHSACAMWVHRACSAHLFLLLGDILLKRHATPLTRPSEVGFALLNGVDEQVGTALHSTHLFLLLRDILLFLLLFFLLLYLALFLFALLCSGGLPWRQVISLVVPDLLQLQTQGRVELCTERYIT